MVTMEKEDDNVERPEELFNHYVKLLAATVNITSGVGTLALLWSTVVLLGGFVSVLEIKEFWFLTVLSFIMAFRLVENFDNELKRGIYMEEKKIFAFIGRQKWIPVNMARPQRRFLGMVLLPKSILLVCLSAVFSFTPYVGLVISVFRLLQRDYGDASADGDVANTAKLNAALDIFYALVLFQSILVIYWLVLEDNLNSVVFEVVQVTRKQCRDEKWSSKLVFMYCSETRMKFRKDGALPDNWNLITYGLDLLQSASGDDDHRWGARVLDNLFDENKSVRQELLSSRLSIQNLMGMIGRRGAGDDYIENRERATRIVARLANDLRITCFQGTLQCICSLLESCCKQQGNSPRANPDKQTLAHKNYHMVAPITEQPDKEQAVVSSPSAGLANRQIPNCLQRVINKSTFVRDLKLIREVRKFSEPEYRHCYKSMGSKELISQGLLILERLTQDEGNCTEMSKDQRLISMITAPLRSHDFLSKLRDNMFLCRFAQCSGHSAKDMMVQVLSKSLTVLSRLLTCPGDNATRLRQELASNTEAVSNLMGILETDSDSEGAQKLHEAALEILAELAFDDSFKELDFGKLFKALLRIFFENEANNTTAQEPSNATAQVEQADDTDKATRLRGRAAEALARLLPLGTARRRVSKLLAIKLLTTVLNEISSSKMGTTADISIGPDENNSSALEITIVENQPLPEEVVTDSVPLPSPENEKQSEERKFISAMLSLAVVICNENVISKEDFAYYSATHEDDEALARKIKEILEVNKNGTAECLRIVKLICQVVIAMIKVKPSCIQNFNGHNFKEALATALETMLEVDDCMLFDGNDREVIKPARSLASLVREAQERLQTA